jgi:gamma-glutamyl phosphate reductase
MPNDPAVQVAVVGILTTLITTLGVVFVALLNNKRERAGAAEEGIEATLRERLTLRDERIADLIEDKRNLQARLDEALGKLAQVQERVEEK